MKNQPGKLPFQMKLGEKLDICLVDFDAKLIPERYVGLKK